MAEFAAKLEQVLPADEQQVRMLSSMPLPCPPFDGEPFDGDRLVCIAGFLVKLPFSIIGTRLGPPMIDVVDRAFVSRGIDIPDSELAATNGLFTLLPSRDAIHHNFLPALEKRIFEVCPETLVAGGKGRSTGHGLLEDLCKVCNFRSITVEM